MAKKPQPSNADTKTTRPKRYAVVLDPEIARQVAIIAGALDLSVPDYVNNRLRPVVDEELPRVLAAMGFKPEK